MVDFVVADHHAEELTKRITVPNGPGIVGAIGPLRKAVQGTTGNARRYLVIAPNVDDKPGAPIQVQR